MARNPKNTGTGVRWVCGDCADTDERKVVASTKAKYKGGCRLCGKAISPGDAMFALDSGVRKTRSQPPPQAALFESEPTLMVEDMAIKDMAQRASQARKPTPEEILAAADEIDQGRGKATGKIP